MKLYRPYTKTKDLQEIIRDWSRDPLKNDQADERRIIRSLWMAENSTVIRRAFVDSAIG